MSEIQESGTEKTQIEHSSTPLPVTETPFDDSQTTTSQEGSEKIVEYPSIDWSFSKPKLYATIDNEFSNVSKKVPLCNNFLRGCRWSPDGCCLLTNSQDNALRLFDFPPAMIDCGRNFSFDTDRLAEQLPVVLKIPQPEPVYDYCWYPFMRSDDPSTCCFASVCRQMPVRLWDAYDGSLRAVYLTLNHLGELTSPRCITFSTDGTLIYCGFNRYLQVFFVDRPKNHPERRPKLGTRPTLSGVISSLTSPAMNGGGSAAQGIYAVGTFEGKVAVFSENVMDKSKPITPILQGPRLGVSQLGFVTPASGVTPWYLVAGGRADGSIFLWDSRFIKSDAPMFIFSRRVESYQRFQFDIDSTGKYLFTGNQTGSVTCYNLQTLQRDSVWRAHDDCCHAISLHPYLPVLATASGQRRPLLTPHAAVKNVHPSELDEIPPKVLKTEAPALSSPRTPSSSDSEDELPCTLTDAEAALLGDDENETLPLIGRLDLLPIRKEIRFWTFPFCQQQ